MWSKPSAQLCMRLKIIRIFTSRSLVIVPRCNFFCCVIPLAKKLLLAGSIDIENRFRHSSHCPSEASHTRCAQSLLVSDRRAMRNSTGNKCGRHIDGFKNIEKIHCTINPVSLAVENLL